MEHSDTQTTLVCANHPDRETMLRCNRCEKPICAQCAVLTPTGYRCKECLRTQQKVFDTAQWFDYPMAVTIAALIAFAGSFIIPFVGFFTILISPVVGVLAAEAVRTAIRKRRSRLLFQAAVAGAVIGALLPLLPTLLVLLLSGGGGFSSLWSLLWRGLYVFLVASTMYYRLVGIQIR
jgi:hypothetical protein